MSQPYLVIPMAGQSARFKVAGEPIPKYLLPILGEPMFTWVLRCFPAESVKPILVFNREAYEAFRTQIDSLVSEHCPSADVRVIESHRQGPSWTLVQAGLEGLDQTRRVWVSYCDALSLFDFAVADKEMSSPGGPAAQFVAIQGLGHPATAGDNKFAYIKVKNNFCQAVSEKVPFTSQPRMEWASTGIYGFRNLELLRQLVQRQIADNASHNGEFYLSLCLDALRQSGEKCQVRDATHFVDLGTPDALADFRSIAGSLGPIQRSQAVRPGSHVPIILAAGRGRRFADAGYKRQKPDLPFGKTTLLNEIIARASHLGAPALDGLIVRNSEADGEPLSPGNAYPSANFQAVYLDPPPKDALVSLSRGLERLKTKGPVHILPCDLFFDPAEVAEKMAAVPRDAAILLWAALPNRHSLDNPSQYSWVEQDDDGGLIGLHVKERPTNRASLLVLGAFSSNSAATLRSLLAHESLTQAGSADSLSERHVESLANVAGDEGLRVQVIVVESWCSLGTPVEYEAANYYQEFLQGLGTQTAS